MKLSVKLPIDNPIILTPSSPRSGTYISSNIQDSRRDLEDRFSLDKVPEVDLDETFFKAPY